MSTQESHLAGLLDAVDVTKTPSHGWHCITIFLHREWATHRPIWGFSIATETTWPADVRLKGHSIGGGVTYHNIIQVTFDRVSGSLCSDIKEGNPLKSIRDVYEVMYQFYFGSVHITDEEILEFFENEKRPSPDTHSTRDWVCELTDKMNEKWKIKDHMNFVGTPSMTLVKENMAEALDGWQRVYPDDPPWEIANQKKKRDLPAS